MKSILHSCPDTLWGRADQSWVNEAAPTRNAESVIEDGGVLSFPRMPFILSAEEKRFLDPKYADGDAKNISLRADDSFRGAAGTAGDQAELHAMVARFRLQAEALVERLFPHYVGHLKRGNASFRPMAVEGRETSWRKDDTRLHIDAFPSNPMRGTRLLRVFTNVNPVGKPREWNVGEPFEDLARRFEPGISRPFPGSAAVLAALGITKSARSEYDHVMLRLHDKAKADLDYQRTAPRQRIDFAPGTTWVVFSDQVLHAVLGGQYMMEHTLYLQPSDQLDPAKSPLRVLEKLRGRPLAA